MEKYGTLEISKEYLDKNQLEDWIQLFLRNDGHNVALADGLLNHLIFQTRHFRVRRFRRANLKTHPGSRS